MASITKAEAITLANGRANEMGATPKVKKSKKDEKKKVAKKISKKK